MKRNIKLVVILVLSLFATFATVQMSQAAAPLVTTLAASSIMATSAQMNGTVNPNGATSEAVFQYGTTTSYGNSTQPQFNIISSTSISCTLSGLTPNTTYHYRIMASNSGGDSYGSDVSFTTSATAPSVTTTEASSITPNSASLTASVAPNGATTTLFFNYGLTTSYGNNSSTLSGINSPQSCYIPVSSLSPNTTYHYRAFAYNNIGATYGGDLIFTTPGPPSVTTTTASSITPNSVSLTASVAPNGAASTLNFQYGLTTSYGNNSPTLSGINSPQSDYIPISNLSPNTTYHYRAVANNNYGTSYGDDLTFTTSGPALINITSTVFSYAIGSSFTIDGIVTDNNQNPVANVSIGADDAILLQCRTGITTTDSNGRFTISYTAAQTLTAGIGLFPITIHAGAATFTVVIQLTSSQTSYALGNSLSLDIGLIGDVNSLNEDTLVCSPKPLGWPGPVPTVQEKSDVGMKIANGIGGASLNFLEDSLLDWKVDGAIVLGVACPFTGVTCAPAGVLATAAVPDLIQSGIVDGAHAAINQIYAGDPATANNLNTFLDGASLIYSAATLDTDGGFISSLDGVEFAVSAAQYNVEFSTLDNGDISEVRVVNVCQANGQTLVSVFHRVNPVISSLTLSQNPVVSGANITLTANGVCVGDGRTITTVEFYRDVNGNGILDPATDQLLAQATNPNLGWSCTVSTAGFPLGLNTYFARAQDNYGNWSDSVSTTGTVNPVTKIVSLSGNLAFGNVTVNSSLQSTLTISNAGNSTMTVSSISYPSGFSGNWSGPIAAGGSQPVTVTFSPTSATTYGGTVTVNSDATGGGNIISASGAGVNRIISLSGNLAFGNVTVNSSVQSTLTINNAGNSTMTVSSISYPSGFSGNWSGPIAAGGSQPVTVTFSPTSATSYGGTVTVNSDATSGGNTISASGTGTFSTTLTVDINGNGTINPNYNGQFLIIGNTYSMTASNRPGFAFVNWTGSFTTNNATLIFMMASNLVLTANFADVQNPTNTITSPMPGQMWSNTTFTVTGTAIDNVAVSNVLYSLNGSVWTNANSANNWSNWTATVNLIAGTNTTQAYAVDTSGNFSATNSVSFDAILSTVLTVSTNGLGSLSPNYNNSLLQVGKSYSITATPGTGFRFTNWTGGISLPLAALTNGITLQFLMQSNLVLQANFVDTNRPALSITNLAAGQRWSNLVFTARGTATDNWQVASVQVQLNGGIWKNATGTTNWSAPLTLTPGTNTLAAYATDTTGNNSLTNSVSWQYVVTNLLVVQASGLGTISPNHSNSWLNIGQNYSMTATPASGFVVTNWTISTNWIVGRTTNNATVQFMMASNLTLQVNFADVTKPKLTITAPTADQHMTNALATVVGTASDNWKVAEVWYQLNSNAWNLVTGTTNNYTNWMQMVTLLSGTNTLKAYAVDLGGNFSTTNTLNVVSSNTFKLLLAFTNTLPMKTNGLVFNLQLSTGLNGHIQVSTNLTSWATLTNFVGTNSTMTFRDPAATNSARRFYRAIIP
jgi:hypothetical protein